MRFSCTVSWNLNRSTNKCLTYSEFSCIRLWDYCHFKGIGKPGVWNYSLPQLSGIIVESLEIFISHDLKKSREPNLLSVTVLTFRGATESWHRVGEVINPATMLTTACEKSVFNSWALPKIYHLQIWTSVDNRWLYCWYFSLLSGDK